MSDTESKNNDVFFLELDKPREIKYGIKAMKKVEKLKNCKISTLKLDDLSADELLKITHAGLVEQDITELQLEELIDKHITIAQVILTVTQAIEVTFGKNSLTPAQQELMDQATKMLNQQS